MVVREINHEKNIFFLQGLVEFYQAHSDNGYICVGGEYLGESNINTKAGREKKK